MYSWAPRWPGFAGPLQLQEQISEKLPGRDDRSRRHHVLLGPVFVVRRRSQRRKRLGVLALGPQDPRSSHLRLDLGLLGPLAELPFREDLLQLAKTLDLSPGRSHHSRDLYTSVSNCAARSSAVSSKNGNT
jgi:hypothetical protein